MKYEECFLRCVFNCLFLDTHASVKCPINLAQLSILYRRIEQLVKMFVLVHRSNKFTQ